MKENVLGQILTAYFTTKKVQESYLEERHLEFMIIFMKKEKILMRLSLGINAFFAKIEAVFNSKKKVKMAQFSLRKLFQNQI